MKKIIIAIVVLCAFASAALLNMVRIGSGNGLDTGTAYQARIAITNGTSSWVLIPKDVRQITCSINVLSNFARVEYTTVRVEDVATTGVIFVWPNGNVTNSTSDSLWSPVSAVRLVALTNIAYLYMRAQ